MCVWWFLLILGYLDSEYDKCYCDGCSEKRGDEEAKLQGRPAEIYAIPRRWYKLGLK